MVSLAVENRPKLFIVELFGVPEMVTVGPEYGFRALSFDQIFNSSVSFATVNPLAETVTVTCCDPAAGTLNEVGEIEVIHDLLLVLVILVTDNELFPSL